MIADQKLSAWLSFDAAFQQVTVYTATNQATSW
jgi:hypothetical protein